MISKMNPLRNTNQILLLLAFFLCLQPAVWPQADFIVDRVEGAFLGAQLDPHFAEGPDGAIYFYDDAFIIGGDLYRYFDDTLTVVDCPCADIRDVTVGDDGSIYIADHFTGLIRLSNGSDTVLLEGLIDRVAVGAEGKLYALENVGLMGKVHINEGESWESFDMANSTLPGNFFQDLDVDSQGNLWVISSDGLSRWDGAAFETFPNTTGSDRFDGLYIGPDDVIWTRLNFFGIRSFDGTAWNRYDTYYPEIFRTDALAVRSDGQVWTADDLGNFYLFNGDDSVAVFPPATFGLAANAEIRTMFVDSQDRLWASGNFNEALVIADENVPTYDVILESSPLQIYPNPTTDYITITLPSTVQQTAPDLTLQLTDVAGRVVLTKKLTNAVSEYQLPVAHLPSGRYYCTLQQRVRRWLGQVQLR